MIWFGGQVIDGGVTSFKVTVKEQVLMFSLTSSAVRMTVWVVLWPLSIVLAGGLWLTMGLALQSSEIEAALQMPSGAEQLASAATVASGGQVMEGGMSSSTAKIASQVVVGVPQVLE